jgi:hypothetical protein
MERKTGYLANVLNVPPLIFRFQFNPELLSEKKSFKYESANAFGKWGFDQTTSQGGFVKRTLGFYNDVKEFGSLLTASKPLEATEGEPRTFELEFKLDASRPGPTDGASHYNGSILPDLAVLRSFTVPTWDGPDLLKMLVSGKSICFNTPPTCKLNYGGISAECVMTDLTIKLVAFKDDGDPLRADVSCTLKEQTYSPDPVVGTIMRLYHVGLSNDRSAIEADYGVNAPGAGAIVEWTI